MPGTPLVQGRLCLIAAVVGFHVLGIWALQTGLVRRAAEHIIPAYVLADIVAAPAVQPAPPAQTKAPPEQPPAPRPAAQPLRQTPRPEPRTDTPTAALAPAAPSTPQPPAAASAAAAGESAPSAAAAPASSPAPAPARVELPSSSAAYLDNPRPPYPPASRRLGEQGKVVIRVLIDTQGQAAKAEIHSSSGYERLDQAALQAVQRWRYVPGKRNGVPEAMWFDVPVPFVLNN